MKQNKKQILLVLTIIFASSFAVCFFKNTQLNKPQAYIWPIPADYPEPHVPLDNPMSIAKVELGRHLFYDKNLSANQTQSCATCHQQKFAFSEPNTTSVGSTGHILRRNSLALVNIAYNKTLTWAHPSLDTIERQLLIPMFSEQPLELGITGNESTILSRFDTPFYHTLFERAFNKTKPDFDKINKALASFTRRLVSFNSPFDAYAYQQIDKAMTPNQLRGMELFFSEKLECHHCHGGFNFTQSTTHEKQLIDRRPFHNTGLYNLHEGHYPKTDQGLFELTLERRDMGAFRAPTLRNILLSAPYMHDGSISTIEAVIDFYANGGRYIRQGKLKGDGSKNPFKSNFVKGFELTEQEKQDLIAFLGALTDKEFINNPMLANPFTSNK